MEGVSVPITLFMKNFMLFMWDPDHWCNESCVYPLQLSIWSQLHLKSWTLNQQKVARIRLVCKVAHPWDMTTKEVASRDSVFWDVWGWDAGVCTLRAALCSVPSLSLLLSMSASVQWDPGELFCRVWNSSGLSGYVSGSWFLFSNNKRNTKLCFVIFCCIIYWLNATYRFLV